MRKRILITNYHNEKLRGIRKLASVSLDELQTQEQIDIDELNNLETALGPIPVDIFFLAKLYIIYKSKADKIGVTNFPSLTSDILKPHPRGLAYQEYIIGHENYRGMPVSRRSDGKIKWVATIKTLEGQQRIRFWENKRKEFAIEAASVLDAGIRQKVAFANHPTKKHVCLFSGTTLYIDYRYPSPSKVKQINDAYSENFKYYDLDIFEICQILYTIDNCRVFIKIFKIKEQPDSISKLLEILRIDYVEAEYSPYVSPGVMSNSPDRLDGYHSYNNDVREITDTGRYRENLRRYTQDRRVYEMWSDGNWKMADRLYATFGKHNISPDHIGPMSLGFAHRPKFQPMTASENSSKGNRMTYSDVQILLQDERNGETVVSWHSKYVWDKFKGQVKNDSHAIQLSSIMRSNLHHVLIILSMIKESGHVDFLLRFLNPHHSYYDYEFIGFNPVDGSYTAVRKKSLSGKNQQNNADRYVRIALEKLDEYMVKENRKNKIWSSKRVDASLTLVLKELDSGNMESALVFLHDSLRVLANEAQMLSN